MSSKHVTRFSVDDRNRLLADVGRVVKHALWPEHPDWVFNTVACVGAFADDGRGVYSDPTSPWFNVFTGYYQIDAPKPDWSRPFAYRAAGGAASRADFAEIVRLARSDWHYFSNWMYGVPAPHLAARDAIDLAGARTEQSDAVTIGRSRWHRVEIAGVEFASAYESDGDEAGRLVDNSLLSGLWREAFGKPCPRPDFPESFIATPLAAAMFMAYWEDEDAFHTTIFGGTASAGADPAFLEAQMDAVRRVIAEHYPTLGFPAG